MSTATKPRTPAEEGRTRPGVWKWAAIAALVVGALVAVGVYYREAGSKAAHGGTAHPDDPKAAGTTEPGEAIKVETVHLSRGGMVKTSTQIGTVQPYEDADLYAKVSGYLSKLLVDYGDRVKRDQLLAEIDDPEVVEDAKKAAADEAQARAAVAQAEAFIESAKADRDAAASAVEQAKAEVERYVSMRSYHAKKYARYQDLVQKKAIPQQIADEEEESFESAKASEMASRKAVLNSQAQLVAAGARVKKAEADLSEAKASVEVARAKRGRADVLVGYTKIKSPYDGVITKRNFFRGAFIRSASEGGTVPLLTVARTDKVRVITQVPDRDVPYTDVGDDAEVTLDALGSEVIKGKVSRFAETEDPTSRTMHTEIDLDNPENKLRPGMYGIARIILDSSTKGWTLPTSCLVGESKDGKGEVYVVKDGKARKTEVKIGADDGIRADILSGIGPDDEVIANTSSVTNGVAVKATASRPEAAAAETARDDRPAAAGDAKGAQHDH